MSKAILVMDMPDSCNKCPLRKHEIDCIPEDYCITQDKELINLNIKPDWCPLSEIPQKAVGFGTDNQYVMGRKDGWNNCLDKLLGE